jgi:Tfp pilus assembly protein PilZ
LSDVVTLARTARESLARGLNALQGDANVPPHLVQLAEPIAQAMGALHQIERSGGGPVGPNAQAALTSLQQALAQLQSQPTRHPVLATATEAVAGALGSVHALARAAAGPAGPTPNLAPQPPAHAPVAVAPRPAQAAPQPTAQAPIVRPVPGVAPPVPPPRTQPQARPAQPAQPAPAAARNPDAPLVIAELGTHSPSNFYKGLSGNDIIDHGGLFVSTYKLPKIGTSVRLKVSLPGGYEFEANALVRWRRESNDGGSDAPPGFGAQFTEIAQEARQLVYRYVRNREPMFHDDL